MKKWAWPLKGALTILSASFMLVSAAYTQQAEDEAALLAVGSPLSLILQTPINTAYNHVDDVIEAAIPKDIFLGERMILSKNGRLKGRISTLEAPIQGKNAVLGIEFLTLIEPDGTQIPLRGYIKSDHPNHLWGGEYTQGTKQYLVTHRVMGIGDYNQAHLGGPRAMGTHIQFQVGEFWTLILQEPLHLPYLNPSD